MNGPFVIGQQCNLSHGQLTQILGVARQAINLWENRRKAPPELDSAYITAQAEQFKSYLKNSTLLPIRAGSVTITIKNYCQEVALWRFVVRTAAVR